MPGSDTDMEMDAAEAAESLMNGDVALFGNVPVPTMPLMTASQLFASSITSFSLIGSRICGWCDAGRHHGDPLLAAAVVGRKLIGNRVRTSIDVYRDADNDVHWDPCVRRPYPSRNVWRY